MSKELFLQQNSKTNEVYAGIILGKDGQPDYHLFLLPDSSGKGLNWDEAMAWAKTTGGDLPTCNEQSLLFANRKTQFKTRWYWSNEQYATNPDYAWAQDFYDSCQDDDRKSSEYLARAVRRIYIED